MVLDTGESEEEIFTITGLLMRWRGDGERENRQECGEKSRREDSDR